MGNRIGFFFIGIFINLQFFTSIPIKKEFNITQKQIKYILQTFPILGLIQGVMYAGLLYLLHSYTPLSDLMQALLLWLFLIILSGGIHLDGWIDSSDAYFSFKDPVQRLEVMKDPRVGAFGVLSVVVFLFTRFIILYELIRFASPMTYLFIIIIPFLGKMLLGIFLQTQPLARKEGMAHFFQQGKSKNYWFLYTSYILIIGGVLALLDIEIISVFLILIVVFFIFTILIAGSIRRNFTGITGDTLGASSEGMELLLWMTLLLLHFYAMV